MSRQFLSEKDVAPRQLHSWGVIDYDDNIFELLMNAFPEDYKAFYELEGKMEEIKDLSEDRDNKFIKLLLRILEVVDFWDRINEGRNNKMDQNEGKYISGYRLLLDELSKFGIKPDGPSLGELPRKGKDVVEGNEIHKNLNDGTICGIIKKCYLLEDKIFRKSKVITVKNGE